MSSSRLSSATVFSPATIRWTVARLNSVVNTRRPSAFRRCSPMGPPAASYVPTVSSRNGEHSSVAADAGLALIDLCRCGACRPPSLAGLAGFDHDVTEMPDEGDTHYVVVVRGVVHGQLEYLRDFLLKRQPLRVREGRLVHLLEELDLLQDGPPHQREHVGGVR